MKLTPFGFVSRSEDFIKDALSLPPIGGGKWVTRRVANFASQSGVLQVVIVPESGQEKPAVILHSRLTGGSRDGGIQGWIERPSSEQNESFILKETDADRAMEEIFDIVEKTLSHVPEWDQSALPPRPEPPPRVFEPLIPAIQKADPLAEAQPKEEASGFDPQALVDAMLSGSSNEQPAATEAPPTDPQALVDAMLSPDSFDVPPSASAEETAPEAIEKPSEEEAKPAKKPAKGKKAKG
jgi:hypothetical protein